MKIEWLINKLKKRFYPITHAKAVLCGENSDKTLDTKLKEIENGTQQVGDSAKLGGKDASEYALGKDYLPLNGGAKLYNPVSDLNDFYTGVGLFNGVANEPYPAWWLVVSAGVPGTVSQVAFNLSRELTPKTRHCAGGTWLDWTDLNKDYLPLSGGTISKNHPTPLRIENISESNLLVFLEFLVNGVSYGHLGFDGVNSPIFRATDSNYYKLLHTGNMAEHVLTKSGGTLNSNASIAVKLNNGYCAPGLYVEKANSNEICGGVGVYSETAFNGEGAYAYIGFSDMPYDSTKCLAVGADFIKWKGADLIHTGNATTMLTNLPNALVQSAKGILSHAHNSVDCTNMTIPQLKAVLEAWANSDDVNINDFNIYTTRVSIDFINKWNSGDNTSAIGWGGWWNWFKLGPETNHDFQKFLVSGYMGTDIYYVENRQGVWSNLRPLLHSENIGRYALPLSGGKLAANSSAPIVVENTGTGNVMIDFVVNGMRQGLFGFDGANNPIFYDTNHKEHSLLHTGNSAKVAIQSSAPSDTSALWVW